MLRKNNTTTNQNLRKKYESYEHIMNLLIPASIILATMIFSL